MSYCLSDYDDLAQIEMRDTANALFQQGWRAHHRCVLMEEYGAEYGLSEADLDYLCDLLAEIEAEVLWEKED